MTAQVPQPRSKPWYRKWRYLIPLALLVIVIIAVASAPKTPVGVASATPTNQPSSSSAAEATPTAAEATPTAAEATPTQTAAVEGDQGIVFGEPVIFDAGGINSVAAMAQNVSDTVRTFTAKATFTQGGNIVATAVGAVNDLAPGSRRAISLLADASPIPAHDKVLLQVDTMLDQGAETETSQVAAQLAFGPPRINNQSGFVTIDVQVTNNSTKTLTLTVGAAFLNGDTLVGTGSGAVNDLAPGETQTASLLATGQTDGDVLVYPDTIIIASQ